MGHASLLGLPACVSCREADTAGPVASGSRVIFGEKEDTVVDIAAASNGALRGRAVEAAVDSATSVTTECPRLIAGVRFTIGTDKCPGLAHRRPSSLARLLPSFVPRGSSSLIHPGVAYLAADEKVNQRWAVGSNLINSSLLLRQCPGWPQPPIQAFLYQRDFLS